MRCPNCGEEVESERTPFCPHCGQNLTGGRSRRKLRFILMDVQEGRRFRHLASAAVIAIVIAAVLSVLLVQWDDPDGNGLGPGATNVTGPSDDAIIVSDREYVELFGDFEDGDLLASMTDAGEMRISLDPRSSSGFDTFSWVLKNDSNGTYETITKDTGTYPDATSINWISPGIGRYTVTVSCSSTVTGETAVYMGWFVFYGDHHMQYSFVHDGVPYTVYIDVSLEEYLYASGSGGPRGTSSVSEASTFVTESPSVKALAGRLSDAYMKTHGGEIGDRSDYAAFILDFVQSCLGETSGRPIRPHRLPSQSVGVRFRTGDGPRACHGPRVPGRIRGTVRHPVRVPCRPCDRRQRALPPVRDHRRGAVGMRRDRLRLPRRDVQVLRRGRLGRLGAVGVGLSARPET